MRLWDTDVTTFDPAIKPDLEEESRLTARYTELLASAQLVDRRADGQPGRSGAVRGGSGPRPCGTRPKPCAGRSSRNTARNWIKFTTDLVRLRHGMARKLGFATYTPLGYRRMRRVDYGPDDVARYREQVVHHVVPLVAPLAGAAPGRVWLGPAALLG